MGVILTGNQVLDTVRFNSLVQDQQERFARRRPLRFLDRTPLQNLEDDEILGIFRATVYAADLVADDHPSAVYAAGQLDLATNVIPNIKIGRRLGQATIARANRLRSSVGTDGDRSLLTDWETATAEAVLLGVRQRINALICAMQIDAYTYNRLGLVITAATWGMPAAYKVTPTVPWTTAATATPITDLLTLKDYAANTDGEQFNRVTMAMADFRLMVATTEFKQLLPGLLRADLPATAFNALDPRLQGFASDLLGLAIEFEDSTITEQSAAGAKVTSRVLPLGKVILSSTADDNNPQVMSFGNAIVTESIVAGMIGGPAEIAGERFGPVGYYEGSLDPPNLIARAVARGWPVKRRTTATAVLTVR